MIQTINITKHYGPKTAVNQLNLDIQPGELFGFLGPNGAGKTTTIRMLVGLLRPSSGTAVVAGHDVEQEPMAVKRAIGYLAQTPLLYQKLTGREFLRFLGGLHGLREDRIQEQSQRLLSLVDMLEQADDLIESYSGGMRHKIGLCGALLHQPQVLILDEPLAGLDPYSARRIKDLLKAYCRQGHTVFLSTHILEIAERLCDRVGILNQGRLIAVGTIVELKALAHQNGMVIDSNLTLEDLFLQLTGGEKMSEMVKLLA